MAMSDDGEDPNEYDWLYSPGRARSDRRPPASAPPPPPGPAEPAPSSTPSSTPSGRDGADPDATQALPAPSDPPPPADAADGGDEHTQVIDRSGPDEAQPDEPAPPRSSSFGGVYAAPAAGAKGPGDRRPAGVAVPPASPPPPSTRPPQKTATPPGGGFRVRRKWVIRGVLILLALWIVYLVVVPIWSWQHITKVDAEPEYDGRPSDTPGTTYLLVGSDRREGLTQEQKKELGVGSANGQRTDTIILLHVPSGDGPRLLLSIPRDSYVHIPGHGMNKINAAYAIGGPKLLVHTIEAATGFRFRVDDYIEVGFTGFVDIVDAVGGITVCPETSINDPKAGHLKMKKGCQEVDGQTALDYSRSRAFALGDITRAEHQREVITQVGKKAASWQTVVFPWRYWKVNNAAAESLQIGDNVGPIDLARFAWAMAHTGGSDSKRCVVPYTSLGTSTSVGSVVTWDKTAAKKIFNAIAEDDTSSIHCSAQGQSGR
jgi:LCP family protein required for cell wall assembly